MRARGLFCGLELKHDLKVNGNHLAKLLLNHGILSKATHDYCLRFTPALVVREEEIHEACDKVEKAMVELEEMNGKM